MLPRHGLQEERAAAEGAEEEGEQSCMSERQQVPSP